MASHERLQELFETALEQGPEQRAQFLAAECAGDPELLAEVRSLLESDEEAGADKFWQGSAAEAMGAASDCDTRIGQDLGPYRILGIISSGGMGTVYLAIRADAQYQKHVAIKVIKRGMDTDLIVQRFKMERQILAQLEHPNIARLLDGGTTRDGLPYLVMEYVEGVPIDEYAETENLSTTQRLELFRTVCSALQYAHQNLVIHRDLKPSNILVTKHGVPKLLDFGIAKLLSAEQGHESTMTVMPFMTPEYASPEQVRGEPITTVSDVYSLGVLLYKVLTGERPYRLKSRRPEEISEAVCTQEPLKPSTVLPQSSLRGDLDNIVLMAIRKEPARRYASVEQFSEDIRRHLAGLTVLAHRDTLGYRVGKFVKRNAAGVVAGILTLLFLAGGVVGIVWQAHVAQVERGRAERRFNDVRKLANSFLFEFHDSIEKIPGTLAARQLILNRALEYLDSLAHEAAGDKPLQSELAVAYDRVGVLTWDVKASLAAHQKAAVIGESLVLAEPSNAKYQKQLADSYSYIADSLRDRGDSAGALENYRHSMDILKPLATAAPDNPSYQGDLADRYTLIGLVLEQRGQVDQALDYHRKAMAIRKGLMQTDPRNWEHQQAFFTLFSFIARDLEDNGDDRGALEMCMEGMREAQQMIAGDPTNVVYQRNLWSANLRVGLLQAKLGDPKNALASAQAGVAYIEKLSSADPGDKGHRRALATTYLDIAQILRDLKRTSAAMDYCERAMKISEALLAGDPNKAETRSDLANMYTLYGSLLLDAASYAKSEQFLERARELAEQRAKADPNKVEAQRAKAAVYAALGDLNSKRRLWPEAREWYQRSRDTWVGMGKSGLLRRTDADKPAEMARVIDKLPAVR